MKNVDVENISAGDILLAVRGEFQRLMVIRHPAKEIFITQNGEKGGRFTYQFYFKGKETLHTSITNLVNNSNMFYDVSDTEDWGLIRMLYPHITEEVIAETLKLSNGIKRLNHLIRG